MKSAFRSFGLILRSHRKSAGISQLELALAIGLSSAQSVSNAERGLASIAPKHFKALSKALNISFDRLVEVHIQDYKRRLLKERFIREKRAHQAL